jgi:DnaJ domain
VNPHEPAKRRVSVDLSNGLLEWLDSLKPELGLRNRGAIIERLLGELRPQGSDEDDLSGESTLDPVDPADAPAADGRAQPEVRGGALDETTAIVLIHSELVSRGDTVHDSGETPGAGGGRRVVEAHGRSASGGGAGGIQLPGFVRRQAREFRRSLEADPQPGPERSLALISGAELNDSLLRVDQHWQEVYGQPPTEPVLEAAMVWLARDVWPQSDHSDGHPFTWSLTQQVVRSFAPSWIDGDANLARVITAAGILEDPFSGSTLSVRVPTLITRFVQRHRSRQKRTTSFEAIDQSMTVHTALRLLQLPTIADRPYSLQEIREAYREQAQCHHPDAGGSADAMRRLNEAYQFLKERYRRSA